MALGTTSGEFGTPSGTGGGGSGSVTSVSVVTANGFAGTVATATTTPAITIKTTITGILKGNGTSVSAAVANTDYLPATSGSAIQKATGSGGLTGASSGTDFAPGTSGLATGLVVSTTGTGVLSTVVAPTGAVVGTTDSQTLTNKTLTAPIIATISNSGTLTLPTGPDTLVGRATTDTLTNKRITRRSVTTNAPGATPSINTDNVDVAIFTGLAVNITSMTTNLSGTPNVGDSLIVELTDNGSARTITWGVSFESSTVTLPATTVAGALLTVGFLWNSVTSAWRCVGAV